jgi:hypothetical protein
MSYLPSVLHWIPDAAVQGFFIRQPDREDGQGFHHATLSIGRSDVPVNN